MNSKGRIRVGKHQPRYDYIISLFYNSFMGEMVYDLDIMEFTTKFKNGSFTIYADGISLFFGSMSSFGLKFLRVFPEFYPQVIAYRKWSTLERRRIKYLN